MWKKGSFLYNSMFSVLILLLLCYWQVYHRLNHVNVCLSYPAVLRLVTDISKQNVLPLQRWLAEGAMVKFIGDNVDKYQGVRDIRSDHHGQIVHMFSILVSKLRVTVPAVDIFSPPTLTSEPLSSFLPSSIDVDAVESNLLVIYSPIICDYIKALRPLSKSVPEHIPHAYSKEMAQKTDVIVLDVLHKNETKNSDRLDIMQTMQSYLGD